jgi:chaperonin cofactor prefoldin
MDNSKKCSHKKHSEKEAVTFCKECKKYWCNKCTNDHPDYFEDHHLLDLKKENQDLFTGLCSLENHNQELKYYCKNHNQLCCAACISKIKGNGDGQHSECDVCHIKDIHDEKKSTLENNIKILEDYSKSIDSSLDELKNIFKTMIKDKDELKKKIYQLFTKIRTALNEREDEICKIIDNKFDSLYFKEDFINQGNKLPNEIKQSLEKGKSLNNENNVLNKFINNCIIIENNIKKIQIIKENIEKCNKKGIKIHFFPEKEDEINKFIDKIKSFGEIKEFIFGGEEEEDEEEEEKEENK